MGRIFGQERAQAWEKSTLEQVESFYKESQALKAEKKKLWGVVLLTVGQLLCYYLAPYLTLRALGQPVYYGQVTLMTILIIMFMAVIPLPGASGGAEFSFQTLFASFISQPGGSRFGHVLVAVRDLLLRHDSRHLWLVLQAG